MTMLGSPDAGPAGLRGPAAPRNARRRLARVIGAAAVVAVALAILSGVLAEGEAIGHARIHAFTALAVLGVAGALVWRWRSPGMAASAPATGLTLFAAAQLIEAIGAFGYGADNESRRNAIAAVHDLGVEAGAVGLASLVVGASIGIGTAVAHRPGVPIWAAAAISLVIAGTGLLVVKVLMAGF